MIYIVIGAFVYQSWEGWSMIDSIYFCFITLTTIGFGDLVPGQQMSPNESDLIIVLKKMFTTLYCFGGLALISMGLSLMQEQVMAKASWLANEIGMNETEDDRIEKYILTKFPDAKFTPNGKGGLKLEVVGPLKRRTEKVTEKVVVVRDDQNSSDYDSLDDEIVSSGEDSSLYEDTE